MIKKKKKTRFSLSNIWSRQRRNFFRGENKNLFFPSQISQKVQVFLSCPFFSFSPLFSLNKSVTELKLKKKVQSRWVSLRVSYVILLSNSGNPRVARQEDTMIDFGIFFPNRQSSKRGIEEMIFLYPAIFHAHRHGCVRARLFF